MTKQTEALHKSLKVLNCLNNDRVYETAWVKDAINACEEALEQPSQEVKCKTHPDAPHGFMRDESHSQDRYVCECEYWTQPAQKPVAWMHSKERLKIVASPNHQKNGYTIPLYTHPAPSWQGLSDDELSKLFAKCGWVETGDNLHTLGFYRHARMLEQALKEKNNV